MADLLGKKIRAADCAIGASDKEKGARAFERLLEKHSTKSVTSIILENAGSPTRGALVAATLPVSNAEKKATSHARDCPNKRKAGYHTSKSDDDESDLDEETLKKAARQLNKRRSIGSKQVVEVPGF